MIEFNYWFFFMFRQPGQDDDGPHECFGECFNQVEMSIYIVLSLYELVQVLFVLIVVVVENKIAQF